MGSQGPTAVHLSWWAQRPGAQAVAHGAPEAFSKHGQAQLWRRDATSRPMPQLSPAEFLASSPVVRTWMSCAESSGAPRTRSSLSRATPPHARYRARRQGAGSHRRAVASGARASAAAPPPQQLLPQQQQQPAAPRRRAGCGLCLTRSQKHEAAMRGANCSAAMPRNEKPHLGPLGGRKGRNWPQRQGPGGSDASRRPWAGLLGGCSWGAPRRERPRCAQHCNIATQHGPRMVYLVLTLA